MYETIRQATLDPDSFFEDRASEPQRSGPALIVAVLGLLYLGTGYLSSYIYFTGTGRVFGMIGGFLTPFLLWLWVTGGFQFISYFFDGSGSGGRTATLVGWGFLPLLIGMGLQFVATAIAFGNAPSPAAVHSNRQALTAVQQLQSDPFVQVAQIARNMTLLWSGYIWVFAVEHARGLSRKNATITLGIVLAITVGYGVVTNLVV